VLLLAGDGRTLAEIAYDKVTASVPAAAADTRGTAGAAGPGRKDTGAWTEADSWTEVEVELAEGTPELLDAVEERLSAAGLRRSRSGSKLARALGDDRPPVPPPPPDPVVTAGQVAMGYLYAQLTAILALDPAVRRDEEDAVHRMRVATRRARSAMKSFRRELDREVTDPIGAELKWLAAVLGGARDREVLAERLGARLAELDPGQAGPDVRRRLLDPGDHRAAHAAVVAELDGSRYFALLDALEALLAAPPYRRRAAGPAAEAAAATVRRDHTRLRHAVAAALALPAGRDRDVALHEARKDAKRARYSSEAARIVLGGRAAAHTARMKGVQQLLGEHQDSVMCRVAVAEARRQARAAGEDTAPYKALKRREREIAADIEARLPGEWRAADRPL
jgi:CHAD domain-containing protein